MKAVQKLTAQSRDTLSLTSVQAVENQVPTPPLKWAGGKRWQLPHLRGYWEVNQNRRLVEPFCGGLAVAMGLRPVHALLNDINPHLINFYSWLQRGLQISIEMENSEPMFYSLRRHFNELLAAGKWSTKEAASIFYYLNRTGFNGLCRFNRSGEFNVPFGSYKTIYYRRDFTPYKGLLRDWNFTCGTFAELRLKSDDFIYADPPYDVEFTQYAKDGFGWEQQVQTAEWLAGHAGPVVLTNQATKRIVKLYEGLGFDLLLVEGPRRISCNGDRKPALEVLATRNLGNR